ncbi:monomethylamine:corrinoid methyltransferase [Methanococcoides sp. FTZ1]|uniref:monomethylamine:corrinoid methyltransferase n=1 Tax=Methanococcoides sp. FTZ1 TaxID=3439061 RepID=UPI003F863B7D
MTYSNMYLLTKDMLNSAPKRTKSEHDLFLYETSLELVDSYDIFYDGNELISQDFGMADRVYHAATELLERVGVHFNDKDIVLEISKEDIEKRLQLQRRSFMIGEDADRMTLNFRNVLDDKMPFIIGGPTAMPLSAEMYIPIHRSYAKVDLIDSLGPGTIHSYLEPGLVKELSSFYSAHESISYMKQACSLEGRPGICCLPPPFIEDVWNSISIANPKFMSMGDFQEIYPLPDLSTNMDEILRAVHYKLLGVNHLCTHTLVMGGMTSISAEQFAIQVVAEALKSKVLYSGVFFKNPTNVHLPTSTSFETMWASFISSIALSRNTRSQFGTVISNSAGPCTKMSFYETAVQTIGYVVCGDDLLSGPILNNGSIVDHAAGLESQFMAEVAELATTLSIEDANFLAMELFNKYKNKVKKPDVGKTFKECYNLTTLEPTAEYRTQHTKVTKEIYDLMVGGLA